MKEEILKLLELYDTERPEWKDVQEFTNNFYISLYGELTLCLEDKEETIITLEDTAHYVYTVLDIIDEALIDYKYFSQIHSDLNNLSSKYLPELNILNQYNTSQNYYL